MLIIELCTIKILRKGMKKLISTLFTVIACTAFAMAGNNNAENKTKEVNTNTKMEQVSPVCVSGTIVDTKSDETLAGATIMIDGKKYYSDLDGKFNLPSLTPGKYRLAVEMISYNNQEMVINVQKDLNVKIQLTQR